MYSVGDINITLELFGVLVSLIIVVCLLAGTDSKSRLTRLFMRIVLCNMAALICDALAWRFDGNGAYHAASVVRFTKFMAYSLSYLMIPLLTDYLIALIAKNVKLSKRFSYLMYILCAIAVGLVVVSQFNNMYYDFDENNSYRVQELFWLSQMLGILYLAVNTAVIIRYWKKMHKSEAFFLLSYAFFPLLAMILHIFIWAEFEFLFIGSTLAVIASYGGIQAQQARQLKQQELELAENRVAVMLSQIQPHFLYNSLVVIKQLCDIDPKTAKEAVTEFSNYLRSNLDSLTLKRPIPFEKELRHVENYLALEQKRFSEKINVRFDINATGFMLPALTLQPIVENAVRYGITKKENGGIVTISTRETDSCYQITVTDNGEGFDPLQKKEDGRSHIGLENVKSRLSVMCAGRLIVNSILGKGTAVTIEIPKKVLE